MGAPKPYNGHHCWNCWNVALWIGNDEGLYLEAKRLIDKAKATKRTMTWAANVLIRNYSLTTTPDGAKYNTRAVTSALKGLDE